MPELPEVETVRRGLEPALIGRTIRTVTLTDFPGVLGELSFEIASARLVDRPIAGVRRRGKFLIIPFEDGDGIIAHLRMTGVLTLEEAATPPPRFHRLSLTLDDGRELRFADQRKFGRVEPAFSTEIEWLDDRLGPEPLDDAFTPERMAARLRGRTAPIKSLLLDQRIVAGLGNIYVDEALYLAGIHPRQPGGSLIDDQVSALHLYIVEVLRAGIEHRGVSFSSFRDVYGQSGENQRHLVVYGQGNRGTPCIRCGTPLERIVISNRGTSFCPVCQSLVLKPRS